MRKLLPVLIGSLVVAVACSATEPDVEDDSVPEWLLELTDELESQPVANPPLWISRCEYGGQVVYYLPPQCCDIMSNLYDADGNIICHPGGGIGGQGDGRCPDFFCEHEDIVWTDPRGAGQLQIPRMRKSLR